VRYDIPDLIQPSEDVMQWLVLGATYILLVLFLIGVVNLVVGLYELIISGSFTDPAEVILLLDTVLVLLIIVEVHRTLLAYARQEPVIQIVVGAGIVAVAREVISFQVQDFSDTQSALAAAASLGVLILTLVVAYFIVRRIEPTAAEL
jgi:Phosphate-starvation-inducible E.